MIKVHTQFTVLGKALLGALCKFSPQFQVKNPVMFVVYVGSIFTTFLLFTEENTDWKFGLALSFWLWLTVFFANFAESVAEGRALAQTASLRGLQQMIRAKKIAWTAGGEKPSDFDMVPAHALRQEDYVLVEAGDWIPLDGDVVAGIATVDESAITGESAPVLRETGDFSALTGGTRVLSDWLIMRVTVNPGATFLDRMIAMVEQAKRQKTPNEIALQIVLIALTMVFLWVSMTLQPMTVFATEIRHAGHPVSLMMIVALLVCLIPTTIGSLLSAIGIAGMNRMMRANIIANSGRAVEAAGDVDILLLDKTGTITLGNRQASAFFPAPEVSMAELATVAYLASLSDETPEGRSIVALAKTQAENLPESLDPGAVFIPFSAQTKMSGVDLGPRSLRKGAAQAIQQYQAGRQASYDAAIEQQVSEIARRGSTPLVVLDDLRVMGVIELKDVVKTGIRARFAQLRAMGITTMMITGDNRLTAAAIAAEAGVDDFMSEATPEDKLTLIRRYQAAGRLVAMTGDGTNDAPALAQADVAVAMNSGTQAAKEAGNMVDLDSNPTKLLEIVEIGKQMLMTRGALTTFSMANDIAKYFAIIPAAFASTYPALQTLNIMQLQSPDSAILSAVIFNALIIPALLPLALRGAAYTSSNPVVLLRKNLMFYGIGGLILPFLGIKLIDTLFAVLKSMIPLL